MTTVYVKIFIPFPDMATAIVLPAFGAFLPSRLVLLLPVKRLQPPLYLLSEVLQRFRLSVKSFGLAFSCAHCSAAIGIVEKRIEKRIEKRFLFGQHRRQSLRGWRALPNFSVLPHAGLDLLVSGVHTGR